MCTSRKNEQQVQMSIGCVTLCSSKENLGKNGEKNSKICLVRAELSPVMLNRSYPAGLWGWEQ